MRRAFSSWGHPAAADGTSRQLLRRPRTFSTKIAPFDPRVSVASDDHRVVRLEWSDASVLVHADWLRDNCSTARHPATTQKVRGPMDMGEDGVFVSEAVSGASSTCPQVVIRWSDNCTSSYESQWLRSALLPDTSPSPSPSPSAVGAVPKPVRVADPAASVSASSAVPASSFAVMSAPAVGLASLPRRTTPPVATGRASAARTSAVDPLERALRADGELPRVDYEDVMGGEAGVYEWAKQLMETGICLVENVPQEPGHVAKVAGRVAWPLQTLYGTTFDVRVDKSPINIANTSERLRPHMDLPYYESPPGLQLLHCIAFDHKQVAGGESTFFDTFVLAEILRRKDPAAFEILCTVPATFQKDHLDRKKPAQYFYRRPHINRNHLGQVNSVFWSPAFEGSLVLDGELAGNPEKVAAYYEAYRLFSRLLEDEEVKKEWGVEFKLAPGTLVSFNQRRLLHGRNAFLSTPSSEETQATGTAGDNQGGGAASRYERWFEGCYVSMDEYLNRFRTLHLAHGGGARGVDSAKSFVGNGSFRL